MSSPLLYSLKDLVKASITMGTADDACLGRDTEYVSRLTMRLVCSIGMPNHRWNYPIVRHRAQRWELSLLLTALGIQKVNVRAESSFMTGLFKPSHLQWKITDSACRGSPPTGI